MTHNCGDVLVNVCFGNLWTCLPRGHDLHSYVLCRLRKSWILGRNGTATSQQLATAATHLSDFELLRYNPNLKMLRPKKMPKASMVRLVTLQLPTLQNQGQHYSGSQDTTRHGVPPSPKHQITGTCKVAERVQIASGASSVRFDDKDHALVVEGTRAWESNGPASMAPPVTVPSARSSLGSACATAQLLCDAHLSYFETFKGETASRAKGLLAEKLPQRDARPRLAKWQASMRPWRTSCH